MKTTLRWLSSHHVHSTLIQVQLKNLSCPTIIVRNLEIPRTLICEAFDVILVVTPGWIFQSRILLSWEALASMMACKY